MEIKALGDEEEWVGDKYLFSKCVDCTYEIIIYRLLWIYIHNMVMVDTQNLFFPLCTLFLYVIYMEG
jgi:hypothetical protein